MPKIEATLSDPLWKKAPPLELHPVPGKDGKLRTTVRVLFGAEQLYAAIESEEPDSTLKAEARTRDSKVWADDCVEIYVLPHPKVGYKQIAVNPLGTIFDQSYGPDGRRKGEWNAHLKVAVSTQPGKGWKIALSVPYRDLGAYAGKDQTWRFNATRVRKRRGGAPTQEYTWAVLPSAEFHQPDAFGIVEGVNIPVRPGGVTRRADELRSGLQWKRLRQVRGVRRFFPHPLDPDVVWCAAAGGLLVTTDNGHNWAPVEAAADDAVGKATCLAVSRLNGDVLCLGTDARGLLLSTDGGKTFKRLGSETERYASNHIEWVDFCPSDPAGRTLMATHGMAAAGMSISRDLGATWEVLGTDRFLKHFVKQAETIVAVGSMIVTEGKAWGIHRSGTDGQRWEETVRNLRPAAAATTHSRWQFFVSTLDGKVLHSFNDGKTWRELVRSEGSAWASLFFTNGPTDRSEVLAAYDPHRQGLCLSRHRFSNGLGERQSRGLYVGPFVKSGANCAANANGTTYYVAMNNTMWVGRWTPPAEGPAVVQARCVPCSVRADNAAMDRAQETLHDRIAAIAADEPPDGHLGVVAAAARTLADRKAKMAFIVRARVQHSRGGHAIRRAFVDASKLGASRAEPMYDDGKHDDGKAGDGLYAAKVVFTTAVFDQRDFRETNLLTVTAVDAAGVRDSWPAVMHTPRGPVAVAFGRGRYEMQPAEGPVTVDWADREGVEPKAAALRFAATGPGPWRGAWIMHGDGVNCAGLKWLTFHIKGGPSQELHVHLMDHHRIGDDGLFDEPHFSRGVPLIAAGCLREIKPTYQKVRVPIAKLLPKGVFFLRWHAAGIALATGKEGKAGTYYVDLIRVEP